MIRVHVFKDGTEVASTSNKERAIALIRQYQAQETHPFLKANFSYIEGEEVFVPYEPVKRPPKRAHEER